jgi:mono/diheme cytochrome c family protein
MPRRITYALVALFVIGMIPLALILKARVSTSPRPRIQVIPDMDTQPKYVAQSQNPLFLDGRAMRTPPAGTIARGDLRADDWLYRGRRDGDWATVLPLPVTEALMNRGRERYGIFCAPCHGLSGYGDGMVARRADKLQEGTWVPPTSYHTAAVRARPVGHIFNTITNGIRTMPPYGPQIPVEDRWAIAAYVRALQRSQDAHLADVPAENVPALR